MIYTAVFQNKEGEYNFEIHVATHDRTNAWHEIYPKRQDSETCLVMLIDGQASVKTYADILDAQID